MGADLLIESIAFKAADCTKRLVVDEQWAAGAFEQARRAIDALDEAFLARINDEQYNDYPDLAHYKQLLMSDLDEVGNAALAGHRQAATIQGGKGILLLISGGLSWGGPPSDLFESMSRLNEAGVLSDAGWPDKGRL
jgi:hypothetical protein